MYFGLCGPTLPVLQLALLGFGLCGAGLWTNSSKPHLGQVFALSGPEMGQTNFAMWGNWFLLLSPLGCVRYKFKL